MDYKIDRKLDNKREDASCTIVQFSYILYDTKIKRTVYKIVSRSGWSLFTKNERKSFSLHPNFNLDHLRESHRSSKGITILISDYIENEARALDKLRQGLKRKLEHLQNQSEKLNKAINYETQSNNNSTRSKSCSR